MRSSPALVLLGPALAACAAGRPADRPEGGPALDLADVPARYQPSFEALGRAVAAHEDADARHILERLEAWLSIDEAGPARSERLLAEARRAADAFGRILEGRKRVDALVLELRVVPADPLADDGRWLLQLAARSRSETPFALLPGPGTLRLHQSWVSPGGRESHAVREWPFDGIERIDARPGVTLVVALEELALAVPPGAMAARAHLSLELRAGEVDTGTARLPAMGVRVAPAEWSRLGAFLPGSPVEPAELERYVQLGAPSVAAALERAVRIPEERRDEALDRLAPCVARASDEQFARFLPAVRWLARTAAPGSDPGAWRRWMEQRTAGRAAGPRASALEMPRPTAPGPVGVPES